MRKKLLWLGLSLALVAAMVLSSCSTATSTVTTSTTSTTAVTTTATTTTVVTSATTTASTTTTAANTPIYGGTFTMLNNANTSSNADPTGWDHMWAIALGQGSVWGNPYLEKLLIGDIEKYGPRGNNSFAFNLWEMTPEQYWTGLLATSWEINASPLTFTYHLRPGVMFTGNQKIGMAPREMTSADVLFSEMHAKNRPGFAAALAWVDSITTDGKYTVVWHCSSFYANWAWRWNGTALGQIWAHESMDAAGGAADWHNQVGTGPYILTDFVSGAGATYTRNPNYWGKMTLNGKEYQLPFIQTVIYPIIPDASTEIAALRTGKIDWDPKVATQYGASLASSSPALVQAKYPLGVADYLKISRLKSATLTNKTLRQALMIGTDEQTIATLVYGGGLWYSWPLAPGVAGYVPQDQLPAAQKALWTYDAAKAKQMIIDAGYPNGFKMEIMVSSANATQVQLANALVPMWAKIGVTVTINIVDPAAAAVAFDQVTYKDGLLQNFTVVNPVTTMNIARAGNTAGSIYHSDGTDPEGALQENMYLDMSTTTDPIQRAAKLQALSLAFMDDCGTIGFTNPYVLNCYWPWFKNYYGELDASYYNAMPMIMRGWIDPAVKKSLGK